MHQVPFCTDDLIIQTRAKSFPVHCILEREVLWKAYLTVLIGEGDASLRKKETRFNNTCSIKREIVGLPCRREIQ